MVPYFLHYRNIWWKFKGHSTQTQNSHPDNQKSPWYCTFWLENNSHFCVVYTKSPILGNYQWLLYKIILHRNWCQLALLTKCLMFSLVAFACCHQLKLQVLGTWIVTCLDLCSSLDTHCRRLWKNPVDNIQVRGVMIFRTQLHWHLCFFCWNIELDYWKCESEWEAFRIL